METTNNLPSKPETTVLSWIDSPVIVSERDQPCDTDKE
jgi:hypothetical protein